MSDDRRSAGYLIYFFHLFAMISAPFIFLLVPIFRIPLAICFFPLFMYHIIYKRCPVTRVERGLHGDDITVLDPFIQLFCLSPNKKTRDVFQIVLSTAFMATMAYYISIMSTL